MSNISAQTKMVAVAVAAGVVVTMSALTVALSGNEARADELGVAGNTSTQAPPPSTPPTTKAAPPMKSPKWHGNGWPGL
jgi:hypothetical protein